MRYTHSTNPLLELASAFDHTNEHNEVDLLIWIFRNNSAHVELAEPERPWIIELEAKVDREIDDHISIQEIINFFKH